jgi:hypothetical protein
MGRELHLDLEEEYFQELMECHIQELTENLIKLSHIQWMMSLQETRRLHKPNSTPNSKLNLSACLRRQWLVLNLKT